MLSLMPPSYFNVKFTIIGLSCILKDHVIGKAHHLTGTLNRKVK